MAGFTLIRRGAGLVRRYGHINWALLDQAMISATNFLTGLMLARFLGIEDFGRFTLAWMVVLFVNSIHHALVISPMMSIGPQVSEGDKRSYYSACMLTQIGFSAVCFALVLLGTATASRIFPEWRIEGYALPLACAGLAFQLQDFLRRHFFTLGRPATAFANDAVRYLGQSAILLWLLVYVEIDVVEVFLVIAGTSLLATLVGSRHLERPEWNQSSLRATIRRHWRFSKWLTWSAIVTWASGSLFGIAAAALLGPAAAGALRAAQNVMGLTNVLFLGLENVMPVHAARHFHDGGRQRLVPYLWRMGTMAGLATAAIGAVAAAAPGFWLALLFGEQYREFGYLLQWFALTQVAMVIRLPLFAGLRAMEQTRAIFISYCWAALFSVVASYPMVYYLGLTGAAAGGLIAMIIHFIYLTSVFSSRLPAVSESRTTG